MRSTLVKRNLNHCRRQQSGLTIVELLISLAITAVLLTATMLAINASFMAYASAAEQASTQAATRLVVHRLLALIRTSTAHGPLVPDAGYDPPVTLDGDTITSPYIELVDARGRLVRVEYEADDQTLEVTVSYLGGTSAQTQPILSGVIDCQFFCARRLNDDGLWVLDRATIDLTVEPADDTTMELEDGNTPPVRMVAATMPRKLE